MSDLDNTQIINANKQKNLDKIIKIHDTFKKEYQESQLFMDNFHEHVLNAIRTKHDIITYGYSLNNYNILYNSLLKRLYGIYHTLYQFNEINKLILYIPSYDRINDQGVRIYIPPDYPVNEFGRIMPELWEKYKKCGIKVTECVSVHLYPKSWYEHIFPFMSKYSMLTWVYIIDVTNIKKIKSC
jgi:hypothetical protein